jgi:dienelactone hydrolase
LLLIAPNWLGVTAKSVETAAELASRGLVVRVGDMYGKDHRPRGDENPTEFIAPLVSNPSLMRRRTQPAPSAFAKRFISRLEVQQGRCARIGVLPSDCHPK